MKFSGHVDQKWGHTTYAQHGDDLMLVNLFHLMGVDKPSYLDLGAHHPVNISNTALLYSRGSRGVNIEANPNLLKAFEEMRPEDENVNVGVGLTKGEFPFFMYSDTSGRNTFSEAESVSVPGMTVKNHIMLPMMTIKDIVDVWCDNKYPDLLLLDIEGLDFDVLQSADFSQSYPKIVCVEVRRHQSQDFIRMMAKKEYYCLCRMGENLFFVRNEFMGAVF